MNNQSTSRRNFLKTAALGAAGVGLGLRSLAADRSATPGESRSPNRIRGQKSVMGLACEPLEKVRIGVIGLGMRGMEAVERLLFVEGVEISAVCDVLPERVGKAQQIVTDRGKQQPAGFAAGENDWMNLCQLENVDLVYICTPWELHTPNAIHAMQQGKHAAVEVPAALTLKQCWELVDTAEQTRRHCMMLENCCYDFFELATLNMARQGVFGEIMHAECAYIHDLRWLKFDKENGYHAMWRLKHSMKHTGNPYPTHGLGPVAQILGINRSDRMAYLTSMSANQLGMSLYAANTFGNDSPEARQHYELGDMNTTLVRTHRGKTILIQHDTTSPRPYSRIHLISGTKGIAQKWPDQRIALEPESHQWLPEEKMDQMLQQYEHPLARKVGEKAKEVGGHGGMDFIMDWRLIHCLRNGLPLDQDVYDAAAWSSIVELSERSVRNHSQPAEVPDFTRGEWESQLPLGIVE
ncbi:MAG TPA: Gfo/Idh/MocA family oxidoreductase [Bacteroidales bacterium]|nr:Gfo/Idh/MocA family oxidoreductase [Bacteroidales bacterium]HNS45993.1 Gfo/Idh/MocA family oxidoreductase [Bacteroidales bacterium]